MAFMQGESCGVQAALNEETEAKSLLEERLAALLAEKDEVENTLSGVRKNLSAEQGAGKSLSAQIEEMTRNVEEQTRRADVAEKRVKLLTAGAPFARSHLGFCTAHVWAKTYKLCLACRSGGPHGGAVHHDQVQLGGGCQGGRAEQPGEGQAVGARRRQG